MPETETENRDDVGEDGEGDGDDDGGEVRDGAKQHQQQLPSPLDDLCLPFTVSVSCNFAARCSLLDRKLHGPT